jgi:putative PIN family toxin of toxin-antitoxin system
VKVVLDTNVVISGVFFGGVPGRVLEAWRDGRINLVLSASILAEYREAAAEFEAKHGGSDFESFAALLVVNSEIVEAPDHVSQRVCSDPDDDKFLACALAGWGDDRCVRRSGAARCERLERHHRDQAATAH